MKFLLMTVFMTLSSSLAMAAAHISCGRGTQNGRLQQVQFTVSLPSGAVHSKKDGRLVAWPRNRLSLRMYGDSLYLFVSKAPVASDDAAGHEYWINSPRRGRVTTATHFYTDGLSPQKRPDLVCVMH